jgi:hypothetical protein
MSGGAAEEAPMTKAVGRSFRVSPFRRVVTDLMHFSRQVPAVTADRRMNLAELVAARAASASRPRWTVIFSKAYGMLSRDYPVLRQSYLKFPRPRIYEHPHTVVALNVERRLPAEDVVLFCLIRGPENRTLEEMDAKVRHHQEAPVQTLRTYRRTVGMSRIPWPARRWFWWAALNVSGRRRCHNFGTFSVSSVGSHGAGLATLVPILTSAVHYGMFDPQGRLDVRITWDHRVMDGATVARILADYEALLTRELVRELAGAGRAAA